MQAQQNYSEAVETDDEEYEPTQAGKLTTTTNESLRDQWLR